MCLLLISPNPEQNQRRTYREVLIAGDLSEGDVNKAKTQGVYSTTDPDTAEFVYGNDAVKTVYFAQPSVTQFVPGGSGAGDSNPSPPMGVKDPSNNTFALTGRNALKNDTGAVLRYAPALCQRCRPIF